MKQVNVSVTLPTPTPAETTGPLATSTPTPTPGSSNISVPKHSPNADEYIYPGSDVISKTSQDISLTSTADPDTITSWYKEKIQSKNFNVNSYVTTTANDKILNKLAGNNGKSWVNVVISRDNTGVAVHITVSISSK